MRSKPELIALDSVAAFAEHAPLWNSPGNQLRRKIGRYTTVYCGGTDGGTVRDQDGKCWDWWLADDGKTVVVVEAR